MKILRLLTVSTYLMLFSAVMAASDSSVLLNAYMRYALASEVQAQIDKLAEPLAEESGEQILDESDAWFDRELDKLRGALDEQFGKDAQNTFGNFVAEYTSAENNNDLEYLEKLIADTELKIEPLEYAVLRRTMLESRLAEPFAEGGRLLSEIQTWIEQLKKNAQTPPLAIWLNRKQAPEPAVGKTEIKKINPLAAAEATMPEYSASSEIQIASPMEAFAQSRKMKRERALADAHAGMQQMAMERQAAEQELASRKVSEAHADAEAMRAQALKLASVEEEAIVQRANSWTSRLKGIVGATIGATTGAFTGGIGADAGRRAADSLFNLKRKSPRERRRDD